MLSEVEARARAWEAAEWVPDKPFGLSGMTKHEVLGNFLNQPALLHRCTDKARE